MLGLISDLRDDRAQSSVEPENTSRLNTIPVQKVYIIGRAN